MRLADWLDALTHKLIHASDPALGGGPVGMLGSFPAAVPDGWLLCNGGTFDGAVYPDLATYLGGTTLPDYRGMVMVMRDPGQTEFDTLGETGGAKTVTLTASQMPTHSHTQNSHDHPVTVNTSFGSTGQNNNDTGATEPPDHGHNINFPATESAAGDAGGTNRWHGAFFAGTTYNGAGGPSMSGRNASLSHTHTMNNHSHNRDHDHSAFTDGTIATSQDAGSGAAHNNLQPYKVVNVAIKAA